MNRLTYRTPALTLAFMFLLPTSICFAADGETNSTEKDKAETQQEQAKDTAAADAGGDKKGGDAANANADANGNANGNAGANGNGNAGAAGAANNAAEGKIAPRGNFTKYQLSVRMFEKWKDYFTEAVGEKRMLDFYNTHKFSRDRSQAPDNEPRYLLEYKAEDQFATVVVPGKYDGGPGWGVYLHFPDIDTPQVPKDYFEVLEKRKLIFVAPRDAGAQAHDIVRLALGLDALATIKHDYVIDEKRVFVGGAYSGCDIAAIAQLNYPKVFRGLICHGTGVVLSDTNYGQLWLRKQRRESIDDTDFAVWYDQLSYFTPKEHKKAQKQNFKAIFYSNGRTGDEDHEKTLRGSFTWDRLDYKTLVLDVPEGLVCPMPGEWFDLSLRWLEGEKLTKEEKEKIPEPRYAYYVMRVNKKD